MSCPDLQSFVETLRQLDRHAVPELRRFFDRAAPVTIARAPGRLDVMGGIADYSGSLVLQRAIAEAAFAALQLSEEPIIEIVSLPQEISEKPRSFTMDLGSFVAGGEPIGYPQAEESFRSAAEGRWAAYVAGAFLVLMRERGVRFSSGARILISSTVPEGKGVASSAALEVAAMMAIAAAFRISLAPYDMALLCQMVENHVAGAPCGVMDQMTSVFGRADALLALLCQPAELLAPVQVPPDIAFWGVDSGERHSVGGASYESVRAGAFMGYRIIAASQDRWKGYLANIDPADFERELLSLLPEEMSGRDFLARYSSTADTVTRVLASRSYRIRDPAAHPVYEHHRVQAFRDLLQSARGEEAWTAMGELMYQSHAGYSACGLGSRGTDRIVDLVRAEGAACGLYGARITGGGSGGTVAVLGRADAGPAVARVAERYRNATGYNPVIFSGTSDGAARFGAVSVNV